MMRARWLVVAVCVLASSGCGPQERCQPAARSDSATTVVRIVAVGDLMVHMPQVSAARRGGAFDFHSTFQYVKPFFSSADIAIANLETTFAGPPYTGFPLFCAPDTVAAALADAGITFVVMANNHAADKWPAGMKRTIDVIERHGLRHTGTFVDTTERVRLSPAIVEVKGMRIAILNYSYSTNGVPVRPPCYVNLIDSTLMKADIAVARSRRADAIVVCMHWGNEYQAQPDTVQLAYERVLLAQGIDAIIGSHPHVVQPAVLRQVTFEGREKTVFVAYSLGNFLSHQKDRGCDGGIMVSFDLVRDADSRVLVRNAAHLPFWVNKGVRGQRSHQVLPVALFESADAPFTLPAAARAQMQVFAGDARRRMAGLPELQAAPRNTP